MFPKWVALDGMMPRRVLSPVSLPRRPERVILAICDFLMLGLALWVATSLRLGRPYVPPSIELPAILLVAPTITLATFFKLDLALHRWPGHAPDLRCGRAVGPTRAVVGHPGLRSADLRHAHSGRAGGAALGLNLRSHPGSGLRVGHATGGRLAAEAGKHRAAGALPRESLQCADPRSATCGLWTQRTSGAIPSPAIPGLQARNIADRSGRSWCGRSCVSTRIVGLRICAARAELL